MLISLYFLLGMCQCYDAFHKKDGSMAATWIIYYIISSIIITSFESRASAILERVLTDGLDTPLSIFDISD